jgi:hypothetical protein
MDIRLPQEFLQKLQLESPDLPKPLSRMSRRASLVSPKRVRGHKGGPSCPSMDLAVLALPVPVMVSRKILRPLMPPAGLCGFKQIVLLSQRPFPRWSWLELNSKPPLGPRVSQD